MGTVVSVHLPMHLHVWQGQQTPFLADLACLAEYRERAVLREDSLYIFTNLTVVGPIKRSEHVERRL